MRVNSIAKGSIINIVGIIDKYIYRIARRGGL
uniref:Uncharacterized protein n=1 Tax=Salmonella phage vB_STmST313_KE27 TaxID=3161178 RepID=A0AAU8GK31_9CAUD